MRKYEAGKKMSATKKKKKAPVSICQHIIQHCSVSIRSIFTFLTHQLLPQGIPKPYLNAGKQIILKMRTFEHIVGLFILLVNLVCAQDLPDFYSKSKHIAELTPRTFDDVVMGTNHTTVVEFYAPWCKYCQLFRNKYKKASKIASDFVQFGAVDCNKEYNKQLCAKYKIRAFPSVLIFRAPKFTGKPSQDRHSSEEYKDAREVGPLVEVLKGRVKNYAKRVNTRKLDSFLDVSTAKHNRSLLLTQKSTLSPLFKSLSIDFLGSLDLAHMDINREGAREALKKNIPELPEDFQAPILLAISKEEGIKIYEGDMRKKMEISKFLEHYGQPQDGPLSVRGKALRAIIRGKAKSFKQYFKMKKMAAKASLKKDEL